VTAKLDDFAATLGKTLFAAETFFSLSATQALLQLLSECANGFY
jgi:hypothetical protein